MSETLGATNRSTLRARAARAAARYLEDREGLPGAGHVELWVSRALCVAASLFMLCVGLWEIGAPFGAGHYAASSAVALAGENMQRFRTLLPIPDHPLGIPTTADAYCHHPFGVFWTSALFVGLLGHHDFVCRLPPVLLSTLTPALCYLLGRALWSPLAGALAAVTFVSCPIALCYANFNALEVPVIFGTLLACLGYVRFAQTAQTRFLWLTLAALVYSVNTDWAAYVFAAGLLSIAFLRGFVFGERRSAEAARREAMVFAWSIVAVLGVLLAYLVALAWLGKLENLLLQGLGRSQGASKPLAEVLASRRYWTELLFTPQGVWFGKLAALLIVVRVAYKLSLLEALPLALLAMALFQYLLFKQGADVHAFWPHYFAAFLALGLAATCQLLRELFGSTPLARKIPSATARRLLPSFLPLLCFLVPLSMVRDAWAALHYARKTGGRFNENGRFIQPDKEKVAALAWLSERKQNKDVVVLDGNMKRSLWVPWVLGGPSTVAGERRLPVSDRFYVIDGRFADPASLEDFSRNAGVSVVGPFWIFDRTRRRDLATGFSVSRREPTLIERVFVSSTHALRAVEADSFRTWEVRDSLGQLPNPPPQGEPRTFEQLRIAHNFALRNGDLPRAEALKARLLEGTDAFAHPAHQDGTRLLGMRFEPGASEVLTLYFESSGANESRFAIRSRVEAPLPGSFVMPDPLVWDVGLPSAVPRAAWKRGYLYSSITELLQRPGRERFYGYWVRSPPAPPAPEPGSPEEVTLLVLP